MNRRAFLGLATAASLLSGCGGRDRTLRYRLAIQVQIGGRIHSGSTVNEVTWTVGALHLLPPAGWNTQTDAGAVTIDLGKAGLLFGLINPPAGLRPGFQATQVDAVFNRLLPPAQVTADALQSGAIVDDYFAFLHGARRLIRQDWPVLVRFRDPHDCRTVELVDPELMRLHYGDGARVLGATLEITDDPVTHTIQQTLPWLAGLKGALLPTQSQFLEADDRRVAPRLTSRNFVIVDE